MRTTSPLLVAVAAALLLTSCLKERRQAEIAAAKLLISDEQENQLGLQVKQELQQQGVKYLDDPAVVKYVRDITNRILPFAKKDRPGVVWSIYVIDDPKTVNAFATPGGNLFVYTGLLLAAENEAELAGVMSHEAGHVVGRHSARAMVNTYGLQTVTGMALGKNPGQIKQVAATLAATGIIRAHGRSEETEADEYGVKYSSSAGYDPHGLSTFFQKLAAREGKGNAVVALLSTHPPSADRVRHANQVIAQKHLTGKELGTERLAPIKAALQAHKTPAAAPAAPVSTETPAPTSPAPKGKGAGFLR